MLTFIAVCLLVLAIFNIVFGVSVFLGNHKSRRAFLFMVFDIAVALWSLGIGLFYLSPSPEIAVWYVKLYYFAAALIAYSLLLFVIDYVGRIISRKTLLLASVPFLLILYAVIHPAGLVGDISLSASPSVELNPLAYLAYTVYFIAYFVIAITIICKSYIESVKHKNRNRLGTLYILAALVVSGVFGMTFNLFLPLIGNYSLIWIGPLGSIWMVVLISIAVIRHSLFDIRVTAAKIIAFLLTFTLFFAAYYCVGYVMSATDSFNMLGEVGRDLIQLMVISVIAISGHSLINYFEHAINKLLFRHSYNDVKLSQDISRLVTSATGLQQLLDRSTYQIAQELGADSAVMVVRLEDSVASSNYGQIPSMDTFLLDIVAKMPGESSPVLVEYIVDPSIRKVLEQLGIILYIPFIYNSILIGFLGLGRRHQGSYNERDVQVLTTISAELAVAMQNALYVQKIQGFNQSLQTEVEQATSELRASNEKLRRLDQTKDEFISLTSHQLRTPLTTIKGYISMLLDGDAGEVTPTQRKLLQEAFNSSQRMVHLIGDFLDISRIQTGKFQIELTDVNLADILDEEIEQLRISATSRQLELIYDKPANFPVLPCDEGKVRQVMMNFVDNAIYYSPPNTTITIVLAATADGIEFKVVDHGIGVPKAEQHKLFTKFARASNARKQRPDGTGIGLFMAKKVIVALGGVILFESQEGEGSTFGFRLNRPKTAP